MVIGSGEQDNFFFQFCEDNLNKTPADKDCSETTAGFTTVSLDGASVALIASGEGSLLRRLFFFFLSLGVHGAMFESISLEVATARSVPLNLGGVNKTIAYYRVPLIFHI